jgi:hypothetical protein
MATGIGQARYSFSTILYVTPQKSLESFEGDCRFRWMTSKPEVIPR